MFCGQAVGIVIVLRNLIPFVLWAYLILVPLVADCFSWPGWNNWRKIKVSHRESSLLSDSIPCLSEYILIATGADRRSRGQIVLDMPVGGVCVWHACVWCVYNCASSNGVYQSTSSSSNILEVWGQTYASGMENTVSVSRSQIRSESVWPCIFDLKDLQDAYKTWNVNEDTAFCYPHVHMHSSHLEICNLISRVRV